jgi:hypothetical protein
MVTLEVDSGTLIDKVPLSDDVLNTYRYLHGLKQLHPTMLIALEKPAVIKGRSSLVGSFTSGRNFGALEAAIRLLYVPCQIIPPVTWTSEMHKGADGPGPKEKSLSVAKRLWPWEKFVFNEEKQVKPHDGIVDAMLIAEFIRRRIR